MRTSSQSIWSRKIWTVDRRLRYSALYTTSYHIVTLCHAPQKFSELWQDRLDLRTWRFLTIAGCWIRYPDWNWILALSKEKQWLATGYIASNFTGRLQTLASLCVNSCEWAANARCYLTGLGCVFAMATQIWWVKLWSSCVSTDADRKVKTVPTASLSPMNPHFCHSKHIQQVRLPQLILKWSETGTEQCEPVLYYGPVSV